MSDWHKEMRIKRDQMGLCTKCGGMREKPHWKYCDKCRFREREKRLAKLAKSYEFAVIIKDKPEVKKEHKCWTCEWSTFLGDRFFCPFVVGTCVKEDKE